MHFRRFVTCEEHCGAAVAGRPDFLPQRSPRPGVEPRERLVQDHKDIEIIGEAASQVTESARRNLAHIPWRHIISMRNRLVHGYFSVNLDIVWETVQDDLPKLLADLARAMATEDHGAADAGNRTTDY